MARGVNKVILIGNLGKDPEVRYFPSGDAIANATIATSESWTDKQSGEKKEATEWHNVVFPGKLGEIAGKYLKKGSKVYVEGSLRTRKWTDKEGKDQYTTEIVATEMQMLGGREGMGGGAGGGEEEGGGYSEQRAAPQRSAPASRPSAPASRPASKPATGFDNMDDDIPF